MNRLHTLAPALCALLLAAPAGAIELPELSFEATTYELDNGLRVVLAPDDSAPAVAIAVYYDVGSRNEVVGRSGFAHLFEHMMFQGSANIGKGEHFQYINRNGGRMNGTTSEDRTNYYEILPADRLALGLWLESDRMRSLAVTDDNFENQREVVKEERRLRVDNQPYVPAYLDFFDLAYENWEYGHSVIGSMDDLDAAVLSDVQAFFDLYYAPNNAVLVIAGSLDEIEARGLVEFYFGDIPRGAEPPAVDIVEPAQTEYREDEREDALATQPATILGWHTPPHPSEEADALEVLAEILGGGESSRFYERLVRQDAIALSVDVYTAGKRGPDLLYAFAVANGASAEQLRDAMLEEVARVAAEGVTQAELDGARERLARSTVSRVENLLGRALVFGRDELYYRDADRVNGVMDRLAAVTADDVHAVAQTYLQRTNCDAMLIRAATDEGDDQ